MYRRIAIACLPLVAAVVLFAGQVAPAAEAVPLKVGFAEADITPDPGMEKPGGYGKAFMKETHDPCKVRAAVFDDGKRRVALVGVDALMVRRALVSEVRQRIQEKCGIPAEAVLIGASHSHSSGPTGMILPGEFDHASELVRYLAYESSSCANAEYLKRVADQIVAAVCQADERRAEAQCGAGVGHEDQVAFNRRFRMKNGQTWTHPGKRNPEIVEPAGPIDPDVGVIGAWNAEGKLVGCVVNYALHGTTGAPGWSANWIYDMEQMIRRAMGENVVVVFLNGDCGDVTQVDNLSPYPNIDGPVVGGRLGAEVVKVLTSMHRGPLGPVATERKVWNIARRRPSPERVAKALEAAKQDRDKLGTWEKETLLLDAILAKHPEAEVEVQADPDRAGRDRDQPRRNVRPVRPRSEAAEQLPADLPGRVGQRLHRLRSHAGSPGRARRRVRNPTDGVQQPGADRGRADARGGSGVARQAESRQGPDAAGDSAADDAVGLRQRPTRTPVGHALIPRSGDVPAIGLPNRSNFPLKTWRATAAFVK